jgi:rare lipoprotein A
MRFVVPMALLFTCFTTASYADQVVRATWYGNEHRGHRTASGEVFNPGGMTAAHKSLAFGTCLLVGNPSTGKKVTVRVNDRGSIYAGRNTRPLLRRGEGYWNAVDTKRDHEPLLGIGLKPYSDLGDAIDE